MLPAVSVDRDEPMLPTIRRKRPRGSKNDVVRESSDVNYVNDTLTSVMLFLANHA